MSPSHSAIFLHRLKIFIIELLSVRAGLYVKQEIKKG